MRPESAPLRLLDIFAGIGGFSLGLEATGGFQTIAFCERDAACRRVLARRWPGLPCYPDVRELSAAMLQQDGLGSIDIITGGFPCQDISYAGHGKGLKGARSGLFFELHRIIGEIRPRYAIMENVAALRTRGLDAVLGSLAAIGYDAEWHCIPASAVGAPHRRDRVWIVAYPAMDRLQHGADPGEGGAASPGCPVASEQTHRAQPGKLTANRPRRRLSDPDDVRRRSWWAREPLPWIAGGWNLGFSGAAWPAEPDVGRVVDGLSFGMDGRRRVKDRIAMLGNSVVPRIPYRIGLTILEAERRLRAAEAAL